MHSIKVGHQKCVLAVAISNSSMHVQKKNNAGDFNFTPCQKYAMTSITSTPIVGYILASLATASTNSLYFGSMRAKYVFVKHS